MKIGWIGLGNMGIPMSKRLLENGYEVTVYNRSREKAEPLQQTGAAIADAALDVAACSDVIFIMVSDDHALTSVFNGAEGLFDADLTGKIIVNMSTISPGINRELTAKVIAHGGEFLDAPVSGSVAQAEQGLLAIMVGGAQETYNKVVPVFEKLGKISVWIGEAGAGSELKLIINTLLATQAMALAEAAISAGTKQLPLEKMLTILNNSALGSVFLKIKGEVLLHENYRAAFALKHLVKDLKLAKKEQLTMGLGDAALAGFDAALADFGEEDLIAIKKYLER